MNKDVLGLIERYLIPKKYWFVERVDCAIHETLSVAQSRETTIKIAIKRMELHFFSSAILTMEDSLRKNNEFQVNGMIYRLVYQEISIYKKID